MSSLVDEYALDDDYWDAARAAVHAHEIGDLLADGTDAISVYWLLVSSSGQLRWAALGLTASVPTAEALSIVRDLLRRSRL